MEKFDQVRMAGNLVEQLEILGFSVLDIHAIGEYMIDHAERLAKYRDEEKRQAQGNIVALRRYDSAKVHPN